MPFYCLSKIDQIIPIYSVLQPNIIDILLAAAPKLPLIANKM